jgi:hypothetical protein
MHLALLGKSRTNVLAKPFGHTIPAGNWYTGLSDRSLLWKPWSAVLSEHKDHPSRSQIGIGRIKGIAG